MTNIYVLCHISSPCFKISFVHFSKLLWMVITLVKKDNNKPK